MYPRRALDSRTTLVLVLLAFFAAIAWWWSLRAGRLDVDTAPTPAAVPAAQSSAAAPAR